MYQNTLVITVFLFASLISPAELYFQAGLLMSAKHRPLDGTSVNQLQHAYGFRFKKSYTTFSIGRPKSKLLI